MLVVARREWCPFHEGHPGKLGVQSGHIRVQVQGEAKDLPSDLQAIVEVTGPDGYIEGVFGRPLYAKVLVRGEWL